MAGESGNIREPDGPASALAGAGDDRVSPADTPLSRRIAAEIAQSGPMAVERYMTLCLQDPDHGYYRQARPLGREGDFITAPEISQIFGELIGLWAAHMWQAMGEPGCLRLIELGPGRGTLCADALRAARVLPGFHQAVRLHLVESSSTLRAAQAQTLAGVAAPHWHEDLAEIPPGPAIVIGNEFLDALPIRQLVWQNAAWHERSVGLDADGGLIFVTGEPARLTPEERRALGEEWPDGTIRELRPAAAAILSTLGMRAQTAPLAALFIDYGFAGASAGDTLQAVARHRYADPLKGCGARDLTAHVDFTALIGEARRAGLETWGPIEQGRFLLALGLEARCERLMRTAQHDQREMLLSGAKRLVDLRQMGALFKVAAFTGGGLNGAPPPFSRPASAPEASSGGRRPDMAS